MYKRRIFLQGLASAGALTLGLASPALASTGHHGGAGTGPVSSVVKAVSSPASLLQSASALNGLVDSQPNLPGVGSLARIVGGPGSLGPGAAGQAVNSTVGGLAGATSGLNSLTGNPAQGSANGGSGLGSSVGGSGLGSGLGSLTGGSGLGSLTGGSGLGSLTGGSGLGSLTGSLGALGGGTSVLDSLLGGLPQLGGSSALGSLAGLPGIGG